MRPVTKKWIAIAVAIIGLLTVGVENVPGQLASRPAEEWIRVLDSPERLAGLKVDEVVASLELKPGQVVADLGAGSGPFIPAFAKAVGSTGKVYGVEIDRNFFPYIEEKARTAGVKNVQTVAGAFTDPDLPTKDLDLAFMHDVLHHVEDRRTYLQNVTKYLKPGGRIAIIDYRPAQSPHSDQPQLQVSKEQAAGWLAEAGFTAISDKTLFADKWFVVYARQAEPRR
jgi:arsenite methyltransferase